MAAQAEAERERRAKVINAEGEFQAAQRLAEASAIISQHPTALQLRFLQTLTEVATEHHSTTIFPLPIDLLRPFLAKHEPPEKTEWRAVAASRHSRWRAAEVPSAAAETSAPPCGADARSPTTISICRRS